MIVTEYDEEMYCLYRGICRYKDKINSNYEIRFFKMSTKKRYKYDSSYVLTDSENYYRRYFGLEIDKKGDYAVSEKMDNIVAEYIKGLFWVFNFYMNCNDKEFNKQNTSDWFYRYSHAPLLFHISKYIHTMKRKGRERKDKWKWMDHIYNSVGEHGYVKRQDFMSTLEYYMYVNPVQKLDKRIIGSYMYQEIMKLDHRTLFGDLDLLIQNIWNGDDEIIDARYTFLNKGRLVNRMEISYGEWKGILGVNGIDLDAYSECNDSIISIDLNNSVIGSDGPNSPDVIGSGLKNLKNDNTNCTDNQYDIWSSNPISRVLGMTIGRDVNNCTQTQINSTESEFEKNGFERHTYNKSSNMYTTHDNKLHQYSSGNDQKVNDSDTRKIIVRIKKGSDTFNDMYLYDT